MINNDIKAGYIELIKKFSPDEFFMKDIFNFINTYDGTNETEFKKLILALMATFSSYAELKIHANTLMELKELDANFINVREELREDYKAALDGKVRASNYPLPFGPSDEPV